MKVSRIKKIKRKFLKKAREIKAKRLDPNDIQTAIMATVLDNIENRKDFYI